MGIFFTTKASKENPEMYPSTSYTLMETDTPGIMSLTGGRMIEGKPRFENLLVKKPEGLISKDVPLSLKLVDNEGKENGQILTTKPLDSVRQLPPMEKSKREIPNINYETNGEEVNRSL